MSEPISVTIGATTFSFPNTDSVREWLGEEQYGQMPGGLLLVEEVYAWLDLVDFEPNKPRQNEIYRSDKYWFEGNQVEYRASITTWRYEVG